MLFDPAWEMEKNGSASEIKKRSLLDYMKKLNPKNALELLRMYHKNKRQSNGSEKKN